MNQATNPAAFASAPQGEATAFNLITEGVGYLNRVRLVKPTKGPTYLACTIKALMGKADAVEYMPFDCIVVGGLAKEVITTLKADLDAERRVIVGFRVGDAKPDRYEIKNPETGEVKEVVGQKARLLQITFAKVNGAKVDIPLVQRAADTESGSEPGSQPVADAASAASTAAA